MDPVESDDIPTPDAPETETTDAEAPLVDGAEPSSLEKLEGALDAMESLYDGKAEAEGADKPEDDAQAPADKAPVKPDAAKPEPVKQPDAKPTERAFTVRGADGKEATVTWPEGAKVVFTQGGKERTIDSMDKLVSLAQKGDLLDLKASDFGREKASWTERERGLTQEVEGGKAAVTEAERVLRAVLTDDDARARVRKAMQQYDDPNAVKARETEEENARLKAERERDTNSHRTNVTERFWAATQERVSSNVGEGKRFPLLVPEDAPDILSSFWGKYEQHTTAILEQKLRAGLGEDAAIEQAAAEGLKWLTEENLYGVMTEMNERYARRLGAPRQDPAQRERTDPEADEQARADKHNARIDKKLQQRSESPRLKGPSAPSRTTTAGAVPAGASHTDAIEKEWDALETRVSR